jgi:hypothetical protein
MVVLEFSKPVKLLAIRKMIRARKKTVLEPIAMRRGLLNLEMSLRSSILKGINQIDTL